jgi:phosphate transport system protein
MAEAHIVRSYDQQISALTRKIIEMGGAVEQQLGRAIEAVANRDAELAQRVFENEDQIDRLEEEIDQQAIRLFALRQPMAIDLRLIAMAMKISNDLERMGDYAVSMARRAESLAKSPPIKPLVTIPRMAQLCQTMVKDILDAYVERDVQKASAVWHRDDEVDEMYNSLFRELLTYMLEDPRNITTALDLLFVAKNLERVGDHATNIGEKIHYMMHGERINRLPNSNTP